MVVMTYFHARRAPLPELGDTQRTQMVKEGKLQQFGSATLTRARWGHPLGRIYKDVRERTEVALGICHQKVVKEPALQCIRALFALLFQLR